jgi:hypothetical protein
VQIFNALYFLKGNNNNNFVFDFIFFIWQLKIWPAGNIAQASGMFFSWLFWAAGG